LKSSGLLPCDQQAHPDTLRVKVTTKAKTECVRIESLADGSTLYRVYVATAPEDGKANKAVIKLLAGTLGIARSRLTILRGQKSRDKTFKIEN
jgi:uncharacterized protein